MRLKEDDIEHVLTQKGVEQPKVKDIMSEIKRLEDQEAELAKQQSAARKKKKMVLVASDPDGRFAQVVDCPVWVVQMNEEDNHTDVVEKINNATYAYNNDILSGQTKSSKKNPVYKVSESLEQVSAKYFKEEEISVKTKEPTVIVRTDNAIPKS
jgi:hypothetical protein|tara:strand:+ start:382 stop:843 length:462 start_codon:yes stop_codon:yes gene_type:complete